MSNPFLKPLTALACAAAVWALSTVIHAATPLQAGQLLNVNFTAHLSDLTIKRGPAAVGLGSADYWNVYSRDIDSPFNWRESGQVTNLFWSDGTAAGAVLSVTNAAGAWGTDSADPMLHTYLYPLSRSGRIDVALSGLPAGRYRLYVYAHGQPPAENGEVRVSAAGKDYGVKLTSSSADWDSEEWIEGGQYVVFDGVEVGAGALLDVSAGPGESGLAVINGLQLLKLAGDAVPACAPVPAGLIAWWPLDGDSAERVGGSRGILMGGATFAQGKVGQALMLNGTDGHVAVGDSGRSDVGPGDGLSIEAWINPVHLEAQQPIVEWNSGTAYGAHFYISVIPPYGGGPGCLYANLVDIFGGNHVITSPGGVIQADQFQHVALTYDRTTGQAALYRDGTLLAQENLGSFVPQTSFDLLLGYRPPGFEGSPFAFRGSLDEISLYARPLAAPEILSVFRADSAGKCQPPGSCAPVPVSVVAWWPGEGNGQDLVGGHNASSSGGVSWQPGEVGIAFALDGRTSRVIIPDAPDLNFGPGRDFSVEAWIKVAPGLDKPAVTIFDKRNAPDVVEGVPFGGAVGYTLFLSYGRLGCQLGQAPLRAYGHSDFISFEPDLRDGQFHHVGMSVERNNPAGGKLFVDGRVVLTFDPRGQSGDLSNTEPARIGNHPSPAYDGFFAGLIDEVSIYARALTDSEMITVFKAGTAGKCAPVRTLPGVAAYWNFDEADGSVAHDSVGAFHGALSAGAGFVPGGVRGNALRLDRAQDGYVRMGNVLGLTDTSFSVVAWVKLRAGDVTENSVVLAKHEAYFSDGYFLDVNRSNPILGQENKAMFFAGDAYSVPVSTTSVNDGLWHQLIAVHELQGRNLLYVDGVLESSIPGLPVVANSASLLIGGASYDGTPQGLFTGWIDEVQIYPRALSAADVALLHGAEAEATPLYPVVSTLAGSGTAANHDGVGLEASFDSPNGGSVGSDGAAYIADTFNHSIKRIEIPSGRTTTIAGDGTAGYIDDLPAAKARFNNPLGVIADRVGGAVFVADTGNNRIRKISADDPRHVTSIAGTGQRGYLDGPVAVAQFDFPNDLVIDTAGNIYVSEFNNHIIRKISPPGVVSTFVGQGTPGYADGPGAQAGLNQPAGLAIDQAGTLYVTEWGSNRIRKITPDAQVTTLAGSVFPGFIDAQGAQARFFQPDGIAAASSGTLYVTEHGNHAVRRILPDGTVSTLAGAKQAGYLDGPAVVAQFDAPGGIGIALDGNLIVADTGNHRVRMISLSARLTVVMPITVTRSLPMFYSPGEPVTVRLEAVPAAVNDGSAYALADEIPSGWTVRSASPGGTYDPVTGKVKFGPFLDLAYRVMTYDVVPPVLAAGPAPFAGTVSAAGYDRPIEGAITILPAPLHPADLSPTDHRMSINETTAYAAAWRKGQRWATGPDPIPIDYMTRAALLWKGGESYRFDPNISQAPLWWVSSASVRVSALPSMKVSSGTGGVGTATRHLPSAFVSGEAMAVQVLVQPAAGVTVCAVEEYLPPGLIIGALSDNGVYDPMRRVARWGPFFDNRVRELTYAATALPPTTAPLNLTGVVSFDGSPVRTGGTDLVTAALRLGSLQLLENRDFGLALGQTDGKAYQVQTSPDLKFWIPLATIVNKDGVLRFKDPDAERAITRFYRAVRQSP